MGLCFGCFSIEKCMCKEEERLTSEEAHAKAAEAAQKRSGATQEISSGQQTGMGKLQSTQLCELVSYSLSLDIKVLYWLQADAVAVAERAGGIGLFGTFLLSFFSHPASSKGLHVWFIFMEGRLFLGRITESKKLFIWAASWKQHKQIRGGISTCLARFGDLSSLEQPGFPRNNQDVVIG
ncbi:hypothetical protein D0Y65_004104 [Glycine soja]|uniref:Uncharacterized protein n=1 Tax=Glycine soja TaxID=3848 RepID=A0A445LQA0_GLYSO|nr:hypothetical protein D0Y65_004104 [Glycine soja]